MINSLIDPNNKLDIVLKKGDGAYVYDQNKKNT